MSLSLSDTDKVCEASVQYYNVHYISKYSAKPVCKTDALSTVSGVVTYEAQLTAKTAVMQDKQTEESII